jgi:hypothetical protein
VGLGRARGLGSSDMVLVEAAGVGRIDNLGEIQKIQLAGYPGPP